MIFSLVIGFLNGKTTELTSTILESAETTIETCLKIFGTIAVWSWIMKIAENSGAIEKMQVVSYPIVKFLFPNLKIESKAINNIALNMTANLIGLGNLATPVGIKAMKDMQEENKDKTKLSKSMVMFLVLNMASIQLIPTTVIGLRMSYGSKNPAEIVIPILIASLFSAVIGVLIVKIFYREWGEYRCLVLLNMCHTRLCRC